MHHKYRESSVRGIKQNGRGGSSGFFGRNLWSRLLLWYLAEHSKGWERCACMFSDHTAWSSHLWGRGQQGEWKRRVFRFFRKEFMESDSLMVSGVEHSKGWERRTGMLSDHTAWSSHLWGRGQQGEWKRRVFRFFRKEFMESDSLMVSGAEHSKGWEQCACMLSDHTAWSSHL